MVLRPRKIIYEALKKPMKYWYPGTDVVREILNTYRHRIRPGDIIVLSDKALSVAYGSIYDEKVLHPDPFSKFMTYLISRILWGKLMHYMFIEDTLNILVNTPLDILTSHKKLTLKVGGLKHFLKPLSEAGVDTTNLPYTYVSLPLKNINKIVNELHYELEKKLSMPINILVVDSDKSFKPRGINNIALATRPTKVKGLIDLGALAYVIGRKFRKFFIEYPTPVAFKGVWLGLKTILKVAKIADNMRGHGLGRNIIEMLKNLGKERFDEITWNDLRKVKHYPVVIVRIIKR